MVGRADEYQLKRDFQIAFLRNQGLSADMHVLDIGCGVLRGGIPIMESLEPEHYVGIDVRRECIRVAKQEVRKAKLESKRPELIHCEELAGLQLSRSFDIVWCFSVLFHLPDNALDDLMGFAARHLKEGGVFYANAKIGDGPDGSWLEFPVRERSIESYQAAGLRHGLLMDSLGTLLEVGHNSTRQPDENAQIMLRFRLATT